MLDTDRWVWRTRAALGQALLDLAAEHPFEGLTVHELVERADVGYATFFRHYVNKEALLLASRGFRPPADVAAELAAHHLAVASLALVARWLEHGMPYGSEKMGQISARLVVGPVGGV